MSRSVGRRKSSLKSIALHREPPGPMLKFKWSLSAAHLALLEDNSTVVLPALVSDRTQRKVSPTRSSLATDASSTSHSSTSTHKSLPSVMKQCKSPTSSKEDQNSVRSVPLSLTFAQLHQSPSPSLLHRRKQTRLSIYPVSEDGKETLSIVTNKILSTIRPSITSTTTISLLAIKADVRSVNEELTRLNSPQLRRLNVSEKYINEAKKLYFNPEWKVFTPRALVAQAF